MSDAFWDCINSEREQQKEQQRIIDYEMQQYRQKLQIQKILHTLMDQNKPNLGPELPFFYLLEINTAQNTKQNNPNPEINCKLIPANKYSLNKYSYEYLYGSCLTQKIIPEEDSAFELSKLERVLTVYEGNIYQIK
jgi:hypothetical protein